jgi:activating signal cointegrator 1
MKVLTIREPFATLIKNKIKYIETRSWKTNYRGELYIHAGVAKIKREVRERKGLSELYSDNDLNYGYIICKCKLIDCIYMTEDFIEEEKKNNPNNFIAGHYEVGRYAWVLKDIEPIIPIKAKGQLGIWNYYNR